MRTIHWQLLVTVTVSLVVGIVSWYRWSDPFIEFYLLLLIWISAGRICGWPNAKWFGTDRLDRLRNIWGSRRLGRRHESGEAISVLEESESVHRLFAAILYEHNTAALCREINDSLTIKIVIYTIAGFIFFFINTTPSGEHTGLAEGEQFHVFLKFLATAIISLLPLIWDYSRIEKQRVFNHEVPEPSQQGATRGANPER